MLKHMALEAFDTRTVSYSKRELDCRRCGWEPKNLKTYFLRLDGWAAIYIEREFICSKKTHMA